MIDSLLDPDDTDIDDDDIAEWFADKFGVDENTAQEIIDYYDLSDLIVEKIGEERADRGEDEKFDRIKEDRS